MESVEKWHRRRRADRQVELLRAASDPAHNPLDYIELVRAPLHQGVFASSGKNFRWAIFGRDSIEVAEDLLASDPNLVVDIILKLATLQGVKTDERSEEEEGKIHHEYRSLGISGNGLPDTAKRTLHRLQSFWGGEGTDDMIYYGSFDSTPLYVRLVGRFVEAYGAEILAREYVAKNGETKDIRHSIERATTWIATKVANSPWRLLEYKRMNRQYGITNQAWKDSITAYLHEDGTWANFDGGVASVEIQGYAYDCLLAGAKLTQDENAANAWKKLAVELKENTIKYLWMEDRQFFAQGVDRDGSGQTRQIKTRTSNVVGLLESKLLLDIPQNQYVQKCVKTLLDTSVFLTEVGIRCRDITFDSRLEFADYHGGNTVWPKETYDFAKALRRHGFENEANDLERRIVASIAEVGEFCEFFYVDDNGTVYYDPIDGMRRFENPYSDQKSPIPESDQAWTISAFVGSLQRQAKIS
jgi:glycogen debranching enzyme